MIGPAMAAGAARVTPWIAASGLLAGLTTYYFHQAFTLGRKTPLLLVAMAIPAVANLILNLLLIPSFGLEGALYATLISYGLGLGASAWLGRQSMALPIPVFIGYDPHERAAVNVLIDSLYQHSSQPLALTPIVARQLEGTYRRERDPRQSTEFSFSRFLVPHLMGYQGWAIFMDCDMLVRGDIAVEHLVQRHDDAPRWRIRLDVFMHAMYVFMHEDHPRH
jgi:hypothetical protein